MEFSGLQLLAHSLCACFSNFASIQIAGEMASTTVLQQEIDIYIYSFFSFTFLSLYEILSCTIELGAFVSI